MNGSEFIKRARRYAKANGLSIRFEPKRGKGSHGTLYLNRHFTTVKDRKKEIGPGLLARMLSDLGITPKNF